MYKFHKRTWDKLGRKKKYYVEAFNLIHNHQQKMYIRANISWSAKNIISMLRTNCHQLRLIPINSIVKLGSGKGQKNHGRKDYVFFALLKSGNIKICHFRVQGLQRQQGKLCKYYDS